MPLTIMAGANKGLAIGTKIAIPRYNKLAELQTRINMNISRRGCIIILRLQPLILMS